MTALRLALAAALLLPTIPRQQPQPPAPALKINTKLTVVNVVVTDKDGHAIHGLKSSDFTVSEDGRPQPIRNFDEYGTTIPARPPAPMPPLPPGIYTNQPAPSPTTSVTNVILLDSVTTPGEGEMYARLQTLSYLKKMPQGTQMAVLMSTDRLRVVQDITTDRDILTAAVNAVQYQPPLGTTVQSTSVSLTPAISAELSNNNPGGNPLSAIYGASQCISFDRQSRLTLDALASTAAYLSSVPGRKNLIWFTPGISWLTNYQSFANNHCIRNYTAELQKVYALLAAAQVSLYAINPLGVGSGGDGVKDLADATGGVPFYNRNDLDTAMSEAITTGSDYYSVTYTPPLVGYDGKFHAIDVKVDRPGLQLQFRKGYTSLDLAKLNNSIAHPSRSASNLLPAISQFRANMAQGAAPSSQLLLATRVVPTLAPSKPAPLPVKGDLNPKLKPRVLVRYDVVYSIVAGQLTVSGSGNGPHNASAEFDIVAYAEDGTKVSAVRQTANVALKPAGVTSFKQRPFEVPLQLDLPPGKLFLRIGALDIPSGRSGTLEVPITVAKP